MTPSETHRLRVWLTASALCVACTGCKPICDVPDTCDIREAACQQAVMRAAACVRGDAPLKTQVHVVSATKYTNEQAKMAAQASDAQRLADWYHGLSLFDLAPSQWDAAKAERKRDQNLAAFYSDKDKTVTVLDRGDALNGSGAVLLLVHEFVHALQDAEHDLAKLDSLYATSFDGTLALGSLTEGEAILRQDQAAAFQAGFDLGEVDWRKAFNSFRMTSLDDVLRSDAPITALRADFVYAYGATYVYDAWRDRGREGVEGLYQHPPVSSRQVMTGYGHGPPGGQPWIEPELDEVAIPMLGADFEYVDSAHMGAFAALVFARRQGSNDTPLGKLRSDVLSVFQTMDGQVLAAWRLRFAGASDAASYATLASATGPAWSSERDAFIVRSIAASFKPSQPSAMDLVQAANWGPAPSESARASGSAQDDVRLDAF
jgi:hypothetical protein